MFDDYLENKETYFSLEQYLFDFLHIKLKENKKNKQDFKVPFYKTTFANGMPFMDGNPILSAKNEHTGELLRVVLDEDAAGISHFRESKEPGEELVIIGTISDLEEVKKEILKWIEKQ
ncbi:hypothetical protein ACVNP3_17350 [Pseudomonas chlororaphis subsp. piscium]